ncbi:MAG: hypothetical protein Q7J16_13360 [Candidatus Cloacimonadales bacterium]|nr:hypothetical protein [Candidatus Cloacimonadales bacterium]
MNVIKQLFDISILFDAAKDINEIADAYKSSHELNCRIRSQEYDLFETLNDTIDASLLLSSQGFSKSIDLNQKILGEGCDRLNQFLIAEPFSVQLSKKHAAKVALIAAIIKKERFDLELDLLKYTKGKNESLKNASLTFIYKNIEKLKAIDPEAFYYWYLVSQIEDGNL